jgi:hypothetical protein
MASIRTHQLVAEPCALLPLLVVRRWEQALTLSFSKADARVLALRVSNVCGDAFFGPAVTLAVLGRSSPAEQ